MIYKIDHLRNKDHLNDCIVIDSRLTSDELLPVLACLQYKLKEIHGFRSLNAEPSHLLELLVLFYGAKEVKADFLEEIKSIDMLSLDWDRINHYDFETKEGKYYLITQLDLCAIEEVYCQTPSKVLMCETLPATKFFEEKVLSYKDFYTEKDAKLKAATPPSKSAHKTLIDEYFNAISKDELTQALIESGIVFNQNVTAGSFVRSIKQKEDVIYRVLSISGSEAKCINLNDLYFYTIPLSELYLSPENKCK